MLRDILETVFIILLVFAIFFVIAWSDSAEGDSRRTPAQPHMRRPARRLQKPAVRPGQPGIRPRTETMPTVASTP